MVRIDRVIRRRLLLGLLLIASLGLLTGYFREGQTGPLHAFQGAAGAVAAPFEEGAQRVARPFRDLWGWGEGLVDAKDRADRAERENARLKRLVAAAEQNLLDTSELEQLRRATGLRQGVGRTLSEFQAVAADVTTRPANVYSSHVKINRGADDGLRQHDAVVAGEGWLVGRISRVWDDAALVQLINDSTAAFGASIPSRNVTGIVEPSSGGSGTLVLGYVAKRARVEPGDRVTTAGSCGNLEGPCSAYPRGIPIGIVTNVNQTATDYYKQIQVTPEADLVNFSAVLVLVPRLRQDQP